MLQCLTEMGCCFVRIEVWVDFVCPFCYVGKRKLDIALKKFAYNKYVKVEYKSYQLVPDADGNLQESYVELLAKQLNVTIDEAKIKMSNIVKQASEVGLTYQLETIQTTNTHDAHRLSQYAAKKEKGVEMAEQLLKAHFIDSAHIGDLATLMQLAAEVGLDKAEVEMLLNSCKFKSIVSDDLEQAKEVGIESVPFFIFNEKYAVPGVQTPEYYLKVLEMVWEEEGEKHIKRNHSQENSSSSYCCGDDGRCS